jgi:hypothetical protein
MVRVPLVDRIRSVAAWIGVVVEIVKIAMGIRKRERKLSFLLLVCKCLRDRMIPVAIRIVRRINEIIRPRLLEAALLMESVMPDRKPVFGVFGGVPPPPVAFSVTFIMICCRIVLISPSL